LGKKYDLVVVGAGNGGLMAGCRASQLGLKTLVIEKHNLPGGCATSFRRGRFEFEASLHELTDFGEGPARGDLGRLFDELGIKLKWLSIPDAYRIVVAGNKGIELDATVPHGRGKFISYMESKCPGCTPALNRLFDVCVEIDKGLEYVGMSRGKPDPAVLRSKYGNFARLAGATVMDVWKAIELPQRCIDILSAYWPYQGADLNTLDAIRYMKMLDGYVTNGAYMPKMRSHEISVAIEKRARQFGCDFWYNRKVTKITTNRGHISGVITDDGESVQTDYVISNIFANVVYGKLLDNPSLVPEYEMKKANTRTFGGRGFTILMGLDKSPEELGIKDYAVFISTSADSAVMYRNCFSRKTNDNFAATCLNIVNPDASPKGTTHFGITCLFTDEAWGDVTPENYTAEKRKYSLGLIKRYESAMGINIRDSIEEIVIATPITYARYLGSPQGAIYGYFADRWDGMMARMFSDGMEQTVPGLRFVGSHGVRLSGFLPTYTSGDLVAKQMMGEISGGRKK
jgi:prolycopene isomerase